ncbi:glycosyltransferase family 10 fucosyltransferase [Rhodoplanes sp. Z2-YC6860]|uniref:glycosyltransferase family 10 fucosyltransferase n=1 Tax=Rhodoplanes sp. Z2-YC6860 TaxID=674703 RepID=UPI00078E60C3|nr:glycosyltransferase family 10 fucosyltransferase [Rhodoplanes sp. Z2-YC6860]AMN38795.1 putative alpha-1,3-fucosyltransferase [Rhodoplanes sp. Z2-YC6860]
MGSRPHPIILFYNKFFGEAPDVSRLEPEDRAAFTWDPSLFPEADAVVFHVPNLVYDHPNLEGFANLNKLPGQLWVAWSAESADNVPVLKNPAFLELFDLVISYSRSADVWAPYCPSRRKWLEALSQPLPAKSEQAPVVMFQSAPANKSGRNEYAAALMTKIKVDSFGRFFRNRFLKEADQGPRTKLATIARYKFCLAFENALETDYVTEKFFDPLLAGTVPVYRGAPNIDQFAPGENAFINVNDFEGPAELALYLQKLDQDDEAYRQFFRWRERPFFPSFETDLDALRTHPFAKLAEIVRRRREAEPRRT